MHLEVLCLYSIIQFKTMYNVERGPFNASYSFVCKQYKTSKQNIHIHIHEEQSLKTPTHIKYCQCRCNIS